MNPSGHTDKRVYTVVPSQPVNVEMAGSVN